MVLIMSINHHTANNIFEFNEIINSIRDKEASNIWFRGHSSAEYSLTPSGYRECFVNKDGRGNKIPLQPCNPGQYNGAETMSISTRNMRKEFKLKAISFLEKMPKNDFEWMFIMQHYGVPTLLLDWTTNALVALYFAINDIPLSKLSNNEEAAIYVINPSKINQKSCGINFPIDIANDSETWKDYIDASGQARDPICILAPHIEARIRAQSGVFTLHGFNVWPIDFYEVLQEYIYKITIPYSCILTIKKSLKNFGITSGFIFPDLSGIAKEIKEQENEIFHGYLSKLN